MKGFYYVKKKDMRILSALYRSEFSDINGRGGKRGTIV